jgi:hypothetical protein
MLAYACISVAYARICALEKICICGLIFPGIYRESLASYNLIHISSTFEFMNTCTIANHSLNDNRLLFQLATNQTSTYKNDEPNISHRSIHRSTGVKCINENPSSE